LYSRSRTFLAADADRDPDRDQASPPYEPSTAGALPKVPAKHGREEKSRQVCKRHDQREICLGGYLFGNIAIQYISQKLNAIQKKKMKKMKKMNEKKK
jgi:hypothetical protein